MIGLQTDHQKRLFYSFDLEEHVPQNHLLRGINRHLDLSDFRQHLSEYYNRPRKRLEYKTPSQVFFKSGVALQT